MARDRDRWRAVVDTAMNIRVPKRRGISSLAERTISFSKKKDTTKSEVEMCFALVTPEICKTDKLHNKGHSKWIYNASRNNYSRLIKPDSPWREKKNPH